MNAADALRREIVNENAAEMADDVGARATQVVATTLLNAARAANELENQFMGWPGMPFESKLYSLGYVCRTVQQTPANVRAMCKARGIAPRFMFDDRPHFEGDAFLAILKAFQPEESK